ncbi:hypothetical protein DPM19_32605 [Actinomadura craniellae]|uniref:Uncharacterized protein n=1 Tax=Actinomadura craniellae TaxID=2231787 RepID=A0A365GW55_9ACTN|nr:hypothetical protein [Actinomadura craniellae]RAY11046.1 hypothetical protein DPM19_32605 [Actinomadura craniellae]
MSIEDQLSGAMRQAVADLQPPPDLAEAGAARGRRMRRRHRLRTAGATAAATALAVAAATLGPAVLDGPDSPDRVVAPPSPAPVSAQELTRTLTGLLPRGGQIKVTEAKGTEHADKPRNAMVSVRYDDGAGPSRITLSLYRLPPSNSRGDASCPPKFTQPYDRCSATPRADGSVLLVNQGYTRPQTNTGEKFWYAVLTHKDGRQVRLDQFNSAEEKSAAGPTRPEPVLTPAQMSAVVTSPQWNRALAAIPFPPPAREQPGPKKPEGARGAPFVAMPDGKIVSLLTGLLPRNVRVVDHDNGGEMLLADRRGTSLLSISVQNGMYQSVIGITCDQRRLHGPGERTCGRSSGPNGAVVHLEEGPLEIDDRGATERVVDVLYPDGRRVAIRVSNGKTLKSGPRTRPEPILALDQLLTIATAPVWRS